MILRLLVAVLLLASAASAYAADGQCVLPRDQIRREHPDLLMHTRSMVVHLGARDPKLRIENCVTCHVVRDAAGAPVPFSDPRHFCNSCHVSAAVKIDCFSCHRSTPETREAKQ